jgi:hypothetical protein
MLDKSSSSSNFSKATILISNIEQVMSPVQQVKLKRFIPQRKEIQQKMSLYDQDVLSRWRTKALHKYRSSRLTDRSSSRRLSR